MDIKDLLEKTGYIPKRKAACHGGEYCSPCPFCKEGDDRFIIHPKRHNKDGSYKGGRFACRVCGKYGDAITFLCEIYSIGYLEACSQLHIEPQPRSNLELPRMTSKTLVAPEPPILWKEKAKSFVEWAHRQLLNNHERVNSLRERGINDESITSFSLGFNPKTFFRERPDWGLCRELKENGKTRMLWLPRGIVIPTFTDNLIIKVKIRRSDWVQGDKLPKYVEISGSKQMPSIYGDTRLSCALVLESELDALLIQQEAGDMVFCVALGGSTKRLDAHTEQLLKKAEVILFLPDFDEAGAIAWKKWKDMFQHIHRILTPCEKSAGDYFKNVGDLREWLEDSIKEIRRKLTLEAKKKTGTDVI